MSRACTSILHHRFTLSAFVQGQFLFQRASVRSLGRSLFEMRLAASRGASRHAVTYKLRLTRAASSSPANLVPVPDRYLSSPRSTPNPDAKNIAVLGGGITGLTTAYHLAQTIPHAKISVFERDRFGGWVDSELVNVGSDETVLFEWGPRSLRPDLAGPGRATLRLVRKR